MKILKIEQDKIPVVAEISGDLKSMQAVVGGYIETVSCFHDANIVLICNEEGKFYFPPCRILTKHGMVVDYIAGTFFLCAVKGENLIGLNDQQIEKYKKVFQNSIVELETL